ncbi:MAG TPA: autotransporter domain-containing protein [Rhodanobacteraceae bacterium]
MHKLSCRPLALALAGLLVPVAPLWAASTPATGTQASASIPLDIIREGDNTQYAYRLGINVGVNGATPEEYLFDTGSDSFNIDVGLSALGGNGPAWFPTEPGAQTGRLGFYLYGDGTYGYLQAPTTVSSMQFYDSATGSKVASYDTAAGAPVAINYAYVTTTSTGPVVGTFPDGTTLKIDEQFQQNLANGVAPEEGFAYGIFGTGDFGNGVAGMLTKSGYIVEANGTGKAPGNCGAACFIEGLTPELRAQFLTAVPWIGGAQGTFALSGAHSASQFDTEFNYTISQGGQIIWSATYPTLFDTGTPDIMLIDNDDGFPPGSVLNPGYTLTATGNVAGAQPSSIVSGDVSSGDYSNVVGIGPYGGFPDGAIYGISFFFHNAVMYDLQNEVTAYTPFYVVAAPITGSLDVTPDMGMLGLAGAISGNGALTVASGGVANLSAVNTYTGPTSVAANAWLGLAGPGSIADSSNLTVDGVFDISRTSQRTDVHSLAGSGTVRLGDALLNLTSANGTFSGSLTDGGLGGGAGGHLIISGGTETLSGDNTYTGPTGVSAPATLNLTGSLAGNVVNFGTLVDNGTIHGSVASSGLLTGNGHIGGSLEVTGMIAPGGAGNAAYQTLHVAGDYMQSAGSGYLVRLDLAHPGQSSSLAVGGHATLAGGAHLDVDPAAGVLYRVGSRYTVLSAAGGVTGTYTLAGDLALSPVLGLAAAYDVNHVYLQVAQTRSLTSFADTANQTASLTGAQSLAGGGAVFTALANLPSGDAIRAAADQLSGEIYASAKNTYLLDSNLVDDAMNTRLDGMGGAAQTVRKGAHGSAWWGQFVGNWGFRHGDGNAATTRRSLGGFFIGHDIALGDSARLGLMGGFTTTSIKANARLATISSQDLHLGVYAGGHFGGAWGLRGGLAYTRHNEKVTRRITVPGLDGQLRGDAKPHASQAFVELGYGFSFKHAKLAPFARAAVVKLSTSPFTEHGSAAALYGRGDDDSTTFTTLGLRAASWWGKGTRRMAWHGTLGWRHASGHVDPSATLSFNGGDAFDVASAPIAHNALIVDTGIDWKPSAASTFDLSYRGQASSHALDSGFHFGFNLAF